MKNQELKERFLKESNLAESSQRNYWHIFTKGGKCESEDEFNKDIYEFTPYECDQLLFSFSARSEGLIFVLVSCFKQYVDFCKINNLTVDDFNYFSTISGTESVRKYVDVTAVANKHITYEQLLEIEDLCENAQDAAVVSLLFHGVKGLDLTELRELTINQVREDKIIMEDREISISTRTYQLLQEAYDQLQYLVHNGNGNDKGEKTALSSNNKRIIKPAGSKYDEPVSEATVYRRLKLIGKYFGNPYLSPTGVWQSGQIHLAKQIKEEKGGGDLSKEDWILVNQKFGYPEKYWSQTKLRLKHLI